nr:hypothetical protein [Mycoplasmopsis bovis]
MVKVQILCLTFWKKEIKGYSISKSENTDSLIFGSNKYFIGARLT